MGEVGVDFIARQIVVGKINLQELFNVEHRFYLHQHIAWKLTIQMVGFRLERMISQIPQELWQIHTVLTEKDINLLGGNVRDMDQYIRK